MDVASESAVPEACIGAMAACWSLTGVFEQGCVGIALPLGPSLYDLSGDHAEGDPVAAAAQNRHAARMVFKFGKDRQSGRAYSKRATSTVVKFEISAWQQHIERCEQGSRLIRYGGIAARGVGQCGIFSARQDPVIAVVRTYK